MPKAHIPIELSFEGKLHNEQIYYIFEKHPITDLPEWSMFLILYVFPLMWLLELSTKTTGIINSMLWIFSCFYFAFLGLFLFISWTNDIFDLFILSDKRLIDVTQHGFLKRKTSIAELHHIQNASFTQKGAIDHILNTGTVEVQTAGNNPDLMMEFLRNPGKVTDLILDFARDYAKRREIELLQESEDQP